MMKSAACAILGLILAANGMVMLVAGRWWYGAVPGVTSTGPYNPHFVKDIGAAYLVVAAALGWRAMRRGAAVGGALIGAAAFLGLHAAVHLADAIADGGGLTDLARDFPGVFLPALLAAWIAAPSTSEREGAR
jgi:hypothetical protein